MSNGSAVLLNDGNLRVSTTPPTIHSALPIAGAALLRPSILGRYPATLIVANLAAPIVSGAAAWGRAVLGER
jgi:hypothetical protein